MTRWAIAVVLWLVPWETLAQTPKSKPSASRRGARAGRADRTALADLRARVDDLYKAVADVPVLRAHLRDIESLLLQVKAQMDRIEAGGAPSRDDEARRELDRLRDALSDLRERVGRLEFEARLRRETGLSADPQGPVLHSADGAFALQLGGRLKLRAEYVAAEDEKDDLGFHLRQAKGILAGHLFVPTLQYRFQTEFGRGTTDLQDYYVDYARWTPWVTIRFGQFKVPFSRQRWASAAGLQFTDRSVATEHFELDRDVGIEIHGSLVDERIQWWGALLNGNGPNTLGDDNLALLGVARIVVSPWGPAPMTEGDVAGQKRPKVGVGGSVAMTEAPTDIKNRSGDPLADDDDDDDGRIDNVRQVMAGIEVVGHWQGASIQFEYFVREEDAGSVPLFGNTGVREYDGAYVQAGYFVVPAHFEAALRAGFAEPHGYGLPRADRDVLPEQINELAVVLSYLRYGHHLKLQAEYAHLESQGVPTPPTERVDHRVRVQLQVDF